MQPPDISSGGKRFFKWLWIFSEPRADFAAGKGLRKK
jgi:hypothetical protein